MSDTEDKEVYLQYAKTDRQRQIIEAWAKHDTVADACDEIPDICLRNFYNALARVKGYAAEKGYIPDIGLDKTPAPSESSMTLSGASIYHRAIIDKDGNQISPAAWIKYNAKLKNEINIIKEAVGEFKQDIPPTPPIKLFNNQHNDKLLNLYTLTDYHIGMLAWHREGGDDWDLDIAGDVAIKAFQHLIASSPDAETAIFCELGDFAHYDSHLAVTPIHKHVLDADGRPQKMIKVMIRVMLTVIKMLCQKYKNVTVLAAEGNHNIVGSMWMRELLDAYYAENDRVKVITSPLPYYAYKFGCNMLGFHHGHLAKGTRLSDVFMSEYRKMFGDTEHLHIHCGHEHHREVKETTTCIIEKHSTLAARDSYASRGGYNSGRNMQVITYHKEFKDVSRNIFHVDMLK